MSLGDEVPYKSHSTHVSCFNGESEFNFELPKMQTLPPEVVANILKFIDGDSEKQALKDVRSTCWALAHAAAPYLFRKVRLFSSTTSLIIEYQDHCHAKEKTS